MMVGSEEMRQWIVALPKAELHLHIEGSLEPDMMFALAERNRVKLPYDSVEAVRAAYRFEHLQSFLDLYYAGADVLRTEQDFFDLCWAYLLRAKADGVVHTEIFFDPQTHTDRGVRFETVLDGLEAALKKGEAELGIGFGIIMCFLRHLPEEAAFETLELARPHAARITGIGLDSSEKGNPPSKFARVFAAGAALGWHLVAHAGEEGPADYVIEALDVLRVERIDHGVRSESSPMLMQRLASSRVPLTVCPLSNVKLRVFPDLASHNLKRMLDLGVNVTLNSDDPAYFGGYLAENYVQAARELSLSRDELLTLARNSLESSFASRGAKSTWLAELQRHR